MYVVTVEETGEFIVACWDRATADRYAEQAARERGQAVRIGLTLGEAARFRSYWTLATVRPAGA